jgi:hypothetical protein
MVRCRNRSVVAAVMGTVAVVACSYNWTSVIPAGDSVIPQRGSPFVTIATNQQRMKMHHEAASFWSPENETITASEIVATGYHDLDVRTCKASARWGAPRGPEKDGSDVPVSERGMIGTRRFEAGDDRTKLLATDTTTGQTWTAASGLAQIWSVTAVPAARRVVVTTANHEILVYDVDQHRVIDCRN